MGFRRSTLVILNNETLMSTNSFEFHEFDALVGVVFNKQKKKL